MPSYYKVHAMTSQGRAYLAKQQTGIAPTLTRAVAGSGFVPGGDAETVIANLEELAAVLEPGPAMQMDKPILLDKHTSQIPLRLMNTKLTDTLLLRMIGIYADDPDEGEILYQVIQFATPQEVPSLIANNGEIFTYNINVNVTFANAKTAVVPFDPGWFISRAEFDATQPTELVATIRHGLGAFPLFALYAGDYAYGLGGYALTPYGGTEPSSIPVKLVPTDYNTVKVYTIPAFAGSPEVVEKGDNVFSLIYPDDTKSLTLIMR